MKNINLHKIKNNNVYFKYNIQYELDAGLVLKGWEVKSLYHKKVDINNCYIKIEKNEVFLVGSKFHPISINKNEILDINRIKKLLLKKKEINSLFGKLKLNNITIVPILIFWNKNLYAKIRIGIAKGKNKIDKKLTIKNRNWDINKSKIFVYKNKKLNLF